MELLGILDGELHEGLEMWREDSCMRWTLHPGSLSSFPPLAVDSNGARGGGREREDQVLTVLELSSLCPNLPDASLRRVKKEDTGIHRLPHASQEQIHTVAGSGLGYR